MSKENKKSIEMAERIAKIWLATRGAMQYEGTRIESLAAISLAQTLYNQDYLNKEK